MHVRSTLEAKQRRSSPSPPVAASMVLDDNDLLGEILLRIAFTTSLVRAALVCRRWLRVISDPAFLRRFCDLHLPRLLGFYIQPKDLSLPKFVPAPNLPAELAAIVRRASSALDAYAAESKTSILDCVHGYLLVRRHHSPNSRDELLNLLPHYCSQRMAVILPPPPSAGFYYSTAWIEEYLQNNGSVRIYAEWDYLEQHKRTVRRCELRDGAWHVHTSTEIELPVTMPDACAIVPVGSKLYLISSARGIAAARSSGTSYLTMITLPDGVADGYTHNFTLWTADDDSVIHLIHVNQELQLHVWLYGIDSENWSLEKTICLRKVDIDVLYIDIKSRTAEKIYTKTPEDADWDQLFPFVMIAPPIFPVIKAAADSDQN